MLSSIKNSNDDNSQNIIKMNQNQNTGKPQIKIVDILD